MSTITIRRTIPTETRVISESEGLCEYIASDETLDSYGEIIRASGWRFNHFKKNAPFVDSHDYSSIGNLLGRVVSFKVQRNRLVETVQWAKDVAGNTMAELGWRMTAAGFLKAVSVGFYPVRFATPADRGWGDMLRDLGQENANVRRVYLEQEQLELSAVVLGANPNAVAKAYKAGVLRDRELDFLSQLHDLARTTESVRSQVLPASVSAPGRLVRLLNSTAERIPDTAARPRSSMARRTVRASRREEFLRKLEAIVNRM